MSMESIFLKLGPIEISATGIIGVVATVLIVALIAHAWLVRLW